MSTVTVIAPDPPVGKVAVSPAVWGGPPAGVQLAAVDQLPVRLDVTQEPEYGNRKAVWRMAAEKKVFIFMKKL
jgi:hypothetical protein